MVSKIAVIALVAIVATPILLGYAFALEPYTKTDYKDSGEYTNVTPLLLNSSTYDISEANAYSLNSDVFHRAATSVFSPGFYPDYVSYGSAVSPIVREPSPLIRTLDYSVLFYVTYYGEFYITGSDNYTASNHVNLRLYDEDNQLVNELVNIRDFTYSDADKTLNFTYQYDYANPSNLSSSSINNVYRGEVVLIGSGNWQLNAFWDLKTWSDTDRASNGYYVDLSQGYTLAVAEGAAKGPNPNNWYPKNFVGDFVYTVDLDTISGVNKYIRLEIVSADPDDPYQTPHFDNRRVYLKQNNGVWQIMSQYNLDPPVAVADLIDNPGQNVYQIKVSRTGYEVRYVGDWPTQIGEANYYRTWEQDFLTPIEQPLYIRNVLIDQSSFNTVMRFDAATYRSYLYKITEDCQYDPANMIGNNNVVTKLQSVTRAGTSITFGGHTYSVSNNDLVVGSHKVPLKGIQFESVLNENNTYDNRIGGTVVSTTATPSTVTFDGKWQVNVVSAPMTSYTYTGTEWKAGEFGWNGIDTNFLIVGLVTCLGVFVALGIYARKRGTGGLFPLMIAVGCAAAVFFIML